MAKSAERIRQFHAIVCNHMKDNNHVCAIYLGKIETSRPNISSHRCRQCKLEYVHEVDDEGIVTRLDCRPYVENTGFMPVISGDVKN